MARRVGADQLVYGSDRPVIEPVRTGRERLLAANGAQLFAGAESGLGTSAGLRAFTGRGPGAGATGVGALSAGTVPPP